MSDLRPPSAPSITTPAWLATSARTCLLRQALHAREFVSRRWTERNTIHEAIWRHETLGALCVGRRVRFRRKMVLMWAPNQRAVLHSERNSG